MIPRTAPELNPFAIPPTWPDGDYFVPPGCCCWYDMQDAGSVLIDKSGHGIHGTVTGGCTKGVGPVPGKQAWVRVWDGVNSRVAFALVIAGFDQSYEFWINPTLVAEGRLVDTESGRKLIVVPITGRLKYSGPTEQNVPAPSALTAATWQHVVLCVVGGATLTMYLNSAKHDGVAVPESTAIGGASSLGCTYSGGSWYWPGSLGCFRVYDRAITQAEVSALFAQDRARFGV